MILVTGSAGKTGRAVIQALHEKGAPVRALVHRSDHITLVEPFVHDIIVGDMNSQSIMEHAVQGVHSIYHICPNVHPDEVSIGQTVITASQSAGIGHFVFHSVLNPQIEAMPHHWNKLRVEEHLIESGLPFTILQPTAYMQNILAHWESIHEEGIYPVPYPAETRLSLVDLNDVALAAAIVLTEPGHDYATYELVGTNGISQTQVARTLSQELNRPVRVITMPLESWETQAIAAGMGKYQVEALIRMFHYYQHHNFLGNPRTLSWLLDRPPTSFATFVERTARERRSREAPTPADIHRSVSG
jgi:NAD(P)H dehydrogenase (quinone)